MVVDPWGGYREGMASLNSAINGISDRNRQQRMDEMAMQQNQRAMRLSDLQFAEMQRRADEDAQLRDALANARGTTQYVPTGSPSLASAVNPPQGMPWDNLGPQPTTGPQVGMENKYTAPNPAQITAQVRQAQGRPEDALKAISLDDALAQYGAKVQAGGGDIRQFYEAKAKLDQGKEFFEAVKPFTKSPETLKAMWPLLTKVYPQAAAISPDSLTTTANGIATPVMTPDGKPVPGKYMLYDNEGKLHIVDDKQPDSGAHNITDVPSADGKTAQKFQYNPQTQRYDIPVGVPYKVKSQVPSINMHTPKPGRMYSVIDTQNGNTPLMMPSDELAAANKAEPGRYLTAGIAEKALKQTALLEDIRGNIQDVRESLKTMPDFSSTQAAQISVAMNDRNPESAMRAFFTSKIGQALTPQQQTYLIRLAQLNENAMAMRSVLGAGQGSDDVRRAIRATIPNAATPSKAFAMEQLDRFEVTLNRLGRGVVKVPLGKGGGKAASDPLGIR